jgi:hypothetical protein
MAIVERRMGSELALRHDLIGVSSILGDDGGRLLRSLPAGDAQDIRLRVAGRSDDVRIVDRLLREVTALWTGGPAGGGGVRVAKRQRLAMRSCLVARAELAASFEIVA